MLQYFERKKYILFTNDIITSINLHFNTQIIVTIPFYTQILFKHFFVALKMMDILSFLWDIKARCLSNLKTAYFQYILYILHWPIHNTVNEMILVHPKCKMIFVLLNC